MIPSLDMRASVYHVVWALGVRKGGVSLFRRVRTQRLQLTMERGLQGVQ